ncbi:MAG: branched-chain amino acid ABC transporter permease [Caldilineaceae bacterium]
MSAWRSPGLWIALLLVAGGAAFPAVSGSASVRETAFTILLAVGLASSLNILLGYTGYVSFGQIVFFGLGGYIGFYAIDVLGWQMLPAALAGAAAAGILALLLGLSILRLRGAYFVLATIGVNEAMKALFYNLDVFGGPTGMELNFAVYRGYGGPGQMLWIVYWATAATTLAVIVTSFVVKRSKFGLALMAIREDEDAAEVMGVVSARAKTYAYVLSAVFPGILGTLFFFKQGVIEPESAFRLNLSIEQLVMVMLGGQGTVLGPIVGAGLYQGLRGMLLTSPIFGSIQLAVAGVVLLLIVLFIPAGAVGWLRSRFPALRRIVE